MDSNGCFLPFVVLVVLASIAFFGLESELDDRQQILTEIVSPFPGLTVDFHDNKSFHCIIGTLNDVEIDCYFDFKGSPSNTGLYIELGKEGDFNSERNFRITKKRYQIVDNHIGKLVPLTHPAADKIYKLKDVQVDFATKIFDVSICKELVSLQKGMGGFVLENGLLKCENIPIPNNATPESMENFRKIMLLATKVYKRALILEKS